MNTPASLARVLDVRGITGLARQKYLAPVDITDLERPEKLPGLEEVRDRLLKAIDAGEQIAIFADYDCDGVLSVAILQTVLKMLGAHVMSVLPTRDQGYGLTMAAVEKFAAQKKRLIVTVDNGITAHEPVKRAAALGIETVIIDHHHRKAEAPEAVAILWNPCYCAAGLCFMVAWALLIARRGEDKARATAQSFARLAAVAMIADAVPLTGYARTLTRFGLDSLAGATHAGLREILRLSRVAPGAVPSSRQIAFGVGPMLNSPGRLGDPVQSLDALIESNPERAIRKAGILEATNIRRREMQKDLCAEMFKSAENVDKVCVLYKASWPRGLVGIMAARAVDHFGVPAFVLGLDPNTGLAYGSARSVKGFHLIEAIDSCSHLVSRYGGHAAAAGFSMLTSHIDEFRQALTAFAESATIERQSFQPETELNLGEINIEFFEMLRRMEPFGIGNECPRFLVKGAELIRYRSYASLLRKGRYETVVRHAEDLHLVFDEEPRDYFVEAGSRHLYLRGVQP